MSDLRPLTEDDVCDAIADARRDGQKLAISGGGSKRGMGHPGQSGLQLDMRGFSGIVDYDPDELVLTVKAGTPLSEIEKLIAAREQKLAFAPFDHGPIYGQPEGASTIGGIIAAGSAGSQRVSQGSARDHLLGFKAVSGRGESFVAGAKVVKNVTGFDLSKLVTGSWGRLVALTEVSLKVLPRSRVTVTKMIEGLSAEQAYKVMTQALGSKAEISAAAHIPAGLTENIARTLLKVEGFGPSVKARCAMLDTLLSEIGEIKMLEAEAEPLWSDLRTLRPLGQEAALWRINLAPREACPVIAALESHGARWMCDWGGGLLWVAFDGEPSLVRDAAARASGHATLLRGPEALRSRIAPFHPQLPGVAALETRLRRAFDPDGIFETGRF